MADETPTEHVVVNNWLPIETAPLGQQVLAYSTKYGFYVIGARFTSEFEDAPGNAVSRLTHWQPLPAPPSEGE